MSSGAPSTKTADQSASTGQLTVQCSCGKRLKAPASAVGKRAKCPACGNVLTISAAAPSPAAPSQAKPAARKPAAIGPAPVAPPPAAADQGVGLDHDDLDGLYALAASEQAAAASQAVDDSPRCPGCASPMQIGAVLCTNCGFDTRTSKRVTANAKAPVPNPELAAKYANKSKKKDKL